MKRSRAKLDKFLVKRWCRVRKKAKSHGRDRMPALPYEEPGSALVVIGLNYSDSKEVNPSEIPSKLSVKAARGYMDAVCAAREMKCIDGIGPVSCYFTYYGIWLYCEAHLKKCLGAEPTFWDLYPVFEGKPGTRSFKPDREVTREVFKFLKKRKRTQIIVLNGWYPEKQSGRIGREGSRFFKPNNARTEELREQLPNICGVAPHYRPPFVTKSGFVCLPTYHSSGYPQGIRFGSLCETLEACVAFAKKNGKR